jgi:hypothetical protein
MESRSVYQIPVTLVETIENCSPALSSVYPLLQPMYLLDPNSSGFDSHESKIYGSHSRREKD